MKFVMLRVKGKDPRSDRSYGMNFERFLYLCFILTFALLLVVQAALATPAARTFLALDDSSGVPLGYEEYLYDEGELVLELLSEHENEYVKVLVNGNEAAVFASNTATIPVRDGDLVEIDASEAMGEIEVLVAAKSPNITTDCLGDTISVRSNVKKLAMIRVE